MDPTEELARLRLQIAQERAKLQRMRLRDVSLWVTIAQIRTIQHLAGQISALTRPKAG